MHVPPVVIVGVATAIIKAVANIVGKNQDRKAKDARLNKKAAEAKRSMQRWRAAFIGLAALVGVLAVVVVVWFLVAS